MGKKPKWLGAVKKAFSPESKDQKLQRRLAAAGSSSAAYPRDLTPSASYLQARASSSGSALPRYPDDFPEASLPAPAPLPVAQTLTLTQEEEHEIEHVAAAPAPAPATDAPLPAPAPAAAAPPPPPPQAQAAIVPAPCSSPILSRELAATKIQTAFRGHLARRALRALKGLVRLKSLVQGHSVKRQATSTLRCMQTLSRVQSKIRTRRIKMAEENQALQRQLLLNQELETLRMGDQWNTSLQSKEQIEASLVSRQEAAARRERALAYAFSHQWKSTSRSANPMFVDPSNPHWGWSWLERWMASRPFDGRNGTAEKDGSSVDRTLVNSTSLSMNLGQVETVTKADNQVVDSLKPNDDKPTPLSTPKPSGPAPRQSPSTPSPVLARKKSATPKSGDGDGDDARSVVSTVRSERPRRHSMGASSVRDDASLSSVPSYMAATKSASARAKSRVQSPMLTEGAAQAETLEKGWSSVGSAKKRLSFPAGTPPPATRRHSGPPKVRQAAVEGGTAERDSSLV
ncbi:protein IQ-DOMAIN 2-like [Triticum urartu]|uniref:Protein IQ-DOMAIN 1 n=1 Tax=Triticum urartu TaxID=4572 RepID=A0A8R7Q1Q5_TRIUA|nr:protein IQ-DOMAIN 2-like [Triticum urartu]